MLFGDDCQRCAVKEPAAKRAPRGKGPGVRNGARTAAQVAPVAVPPPEAPVASSPSTTRTKPLELNQSPEEAKAEMMVKGLGMNTVTAVAYSQTLGPLDLADCMVALTAEARKVQSGNMGGLEAILTGQAIALNAMFTELAYRASQMKTGDQNERFMRLALRAQTQCRATFETLALTKNPPHGVRSSGQHRARSAAGQQRDAGGRRVACARAKTGSSANRTIGGRCRTGGRRHDARSRRRRSGAGGRGSGRPVREPLTGSSAARAMPFAEASGRGFEIW